MCIILTCEQNVRPTHELLDVCFNNNPDGAGIMWVEDGVVCTDKGFYSLRTLEAAIEDVPLNSRLVIHMRIATSGGINVGTCHPFPICNDLEELHAPFTECDAAVAHNGIISGVPTDDKRGISDTVYFVSHYVNNLYNEEGLTKSSLRRIKEAAPGNRFAIMTNDGAVHRLGVGWQTVTKGIQASNGSWRYNKYLWNYSLWDDEDWDDEDWDDEYWSDYSNGWYDTKYNEYYDNDDRWGYGSGWKESKTWYVDEDEEEDVYGPEYIEIFNSMCGECKSRATCLAFGPICRAVSDAVEELKYACA